MIWNFLYIFYRNNNDCMNRKLRFKKSKHETQTGNFMKYSNILTCKNF